MCTIKMGIKAINYNGTQTYRGEGRLCEFLIVKFLKLLLSKCCIFSTNFTLR